MVIYSGSGSKSLTEESIETLRCKVPKGTLVWLEVFAVHEGKTFTLYPFSFCSIAVTSLVVMTQEAV